MLTRFEVSDNSEMSFLYVVVAELLQELETYNRTTSCVYEVV